MALNKNGGITCTRFKIVKMFTLFWSSAGLYFSISTAVLMSTKGLSGLSIKKPNWCVIYSLSAAKRKQQASALQ